MWQISISIKWREKNIHTTNLGFCRCSFSLRLRRNFVVVLRSSYLVSIHPIIWSSKWMAYLGNHLPTVTKSMNEIYTLKWWCCYGLLRMLPYTICHHHNGAQWRILRIFLLIVKTIISSAKSLEDLGSVYKWFLFECSLRLAISVPEPLW